MTYLLHDTANGLSRSDRAYAQGKLAKLVKFLPGLRSVNLVHAEDKLDHKAELHIHGDGVVLRVIGKAKSIRAAVDLAVNRACGKLKRVRSKVVTRKRAPVPA